MRAAANRVLMINSLPACEGAALRSGNGAITGSPISNTHSPPTADPEQSRGSRAQGAGTWAVPAPRRCMWRSMRASRRSLEGPSRPSASSMGVRSCLRSATCKLRAPLRGTCCTAATGTSFRSRMQRAFCGRRVSWHLLGQLCDTRHGSSACLHALSRQTGSLCDSGSRVHPHRSIETAGMHVCAYACLPACSAGLDRITPLGGGEGWNKRGRRGRRGTY